MSLISTLENLLAGISWSAVSENIVAGAISAIFIYVLSYFAFLRRYSDRMKDEVKRMVNPVESFRNVEEFSRLLLDTLDAYKEDYKTAVLFRAMPCEITEKFRAHVSEDTDTSAREMIMRYQRAVGVIVKSSKGAHDDSVFGRTGIPALDDATEKIVLEHYLAGELLPGTTTLSLHENLNEYGVILFGVNDEVARVGDVLWKAGFLVVFSKDFKKIRGYRYNQHAHIQNLHLMFEQKRLDSHAYEFDPHMPDSERERMCADIKAFFHRGELTGSSTPHLHAVKVNQ